MRPTALCFYRSPHEDIRVALLAAIERANRMLISRLQSARGAGKG